MSDSSEALIEKLRRMLRELDSIYSEHVADYDEVLPHVFMGDVTRFVIANIDQLASSGRLVALLNEFEDQCEHGSEEVRELIGVSFLENLLGEDGVIRRMLPIMGPCVRREAREILGV